MTMQVLTSITDISEFSTISALHDKPPSLIPDRRDSVSHLVSFQVM